MPGEQILVIDDSPTITKAVQLVLSRSGYHVEIADDGEAGLLAARQRRPDLVLLDFVMPRMNGYQVCRALAADPELASVPVVLMSAKGDQVGERFVRMMGIVEYVTKPFSPERLSEVVARAIARGPAAPPPAVGRTTTRPIFEDTLDSLDEPLPGLGGRAEEAEAPGGEADLRGELRVIPLSEILRLLDEQELSGRLTIQHAHQRIEICLRRGKVEQALAQGLAEELRLGRFVLDRGLMDHARFDAFLQQRSGAELLGQQLLAAGHLDEGELRTALTRQTSELVFEALRWRAGRFAFHADLELPAAAREANLALAVDALVEEGCRRADTWHLIERMIDSAAIVFALDEPLPRGRRISREEQLVLEQVDGRRSVAELQRATRLGSFDVFHALYRLISLKLVRRAAAE